MYQYTKNNHAVWGWGNGDYNRPSGNPLEPWHFTTGKCSREHMGFRKEAILAAKEMCDSTAKPIMLAFSGGIDSQVVFLSLIENNIEFVPLIIRYKFKEQSLNEHDISAAFEMCSRYKIIPKVEELDVRTCWFDKQKFVHEHQISDVSRLTILMMAQKYSKYYFIMGGGDPVLFPNADASQWEWVHNPTPHLQYFMNNNQEGNTKFFWWSPELIASLIDNKGMHLFSCALKTMSQSFEDYCRRFFPKRQKYFSELYCDWCKPLVYVDAFPELIQRKKYVGFETFAENLGPWYMEKLKELFVPYKEICDKRAININLVELTDYMNNNNAEKRVWLSNSNNLLCLSQAV